jgi:hypothetical protein
MNSTQRRRVERLLRVDAYALASVADFPETSKGGRAADDLRDILAEIETHAVARESSMNALQHSTIAKKDARAAIHVYLRAISDTARTIGLDHPEIKGSLKFTGASVGDRTLLATARAFAAAVQPLKTLFVEYDMTADFFDKFNADINNFEQQLDRQTAGKGERIAVNASLEDALHRAEAALKRYSTAVRNRYRNDPAKLAAWESAHRIERAPRTKRKDATSQTPPQT